MSLRVTSRVNIVTLHKNSRRGAAILIANLPTEQYYQFYTEIDANRLNL